MKVRKIVLIIILLATIIGMPTFAEAKKSWDEKMDIGMDIFEEWIETFKSEEAPIEKRIIDYQISQFRWWCS